MATVQTIKRQNETLEMS